MKYGILSFKGTVHEFRLFLKSLRKDLEEGVLPSAPALPDTITVRKSAWWYWQYNYFYGIVKVSYELKSDAVIQA